MILKSGKEVVLVIPDLQCPFEHPDSVEFLNAVGLAYQVERVVCIGDSLDAHALSRWKSDPDGRSPWDEYEEGIKHLKKLYDAWPRVDEVRSNHNERIAKRAFDGGLPQGFLKSYEEIMQYPSGWKIHNEIVVDGVMYEHGHSHGGIHAARNAAIHNRQSTVIGHHHSNAGVSYVANRSNMIWGMNVGCLIDIKAYAFAYARDAKFKPTLGCGVVVRGVPHFVPMLLNKKLRWVGDID